MTVLTKADLEILAAFDKMDEAEFKVFFDRAKAQAEELDRNCRVRRDLINAHGLELLDALNDMLEAYAPRAAQTVAESGEEALHPAVYKARKLIRKLECEKI